MSILDCSFFAHFSLNEIVNEYLNFAPYIRKFVNYLLPIFLICKPGGLDLSRRDLDRDLDLDAQKVSISTVFKS